jgi:hypothetical protein
MRAMRRRELCLDAGGVHVAWARAGAGAGADDGV